MAKKKMGGLGKGLDLLFADLPETSSDDAAASTLPLREIEPDPAQPRKQFDDDALNQHYRKRPAAAHCCTPQKTGHRLHHHCGRAPLACRPAGRAG